MLDLVPLAGPRGIMTDCHVQARLVRPTIACYSAAISSEPGNATGFRRGGIADRWTKPVAATQFVASRRKPICCGGGDLGNCISAEQVSPALAQAEGRQAVAAIRDGVNGSLANLRIAGIDPIVTTACGGPIAGTAPCGA